MDGARTCDHVCNKETSPLLDRKTAAVRLGYLSRLHPYGRRTQTVPELAHTADACPNKHPSTANAHAQRDERGLPLPWLHLQGFLQSRAKVS